MKLFFQAILVYCTIAGSISFGQAPSIDKVRFFTDTSVIHANIITNTGKLFGHFKKGYVLPAVFSGTLPDGTAINDQILLEVRGHFRHDYCYFPPLKLIFKTNTSSALYPLKSLKLVSQCKGFGDYDQYLLKEFIIYKIYNLITDMSFRVRLLNLNLKDSSGKKKTVNDLAFLIEDIKDVAKRNNCKEWGSQPLNTESTNRRQMTIVAVFEYMIGNTDYGVSVNHNTKLIVNTGDSLSRPSVVPYDFDYSGLVNTEYAVPDEKLEIENVRQRLYRGFPRTMDELNEVLDIFKKEKKSIYATINNFNLLTPASKRQMTSYLDEFYETINNPSDVKFTFIDRARTR
jgi:hypothetical protein